jgi:hypothetical protein
MKENSLPRHGSTLLRTIVVLIAVGLSSEVWAQRLCSGGTADGQPCASLEACPNGACVVAQGVCDGGDYDGFDCDCPGSTCVDTPACSFDPQAGTCGGGILAGECCDVEFNCVDGSPCSGTQKVCLEGEVLKGLACLRDAHCDGSPCVATGKLCGDGFACVDDSNCITGTCEAGSVVPTPTPPPSATVSPTASTPTPGPSACIGDCDGDGEVTVDNLLVMVNISLGTTPANVCPAGDANGDGEITVDEIIAGVNSLLTGCPL